MTGERPPPCSNFSIIAVSDHRAVMFGGYQGEGNRMNDVYIAEFGKESVVSVSLRFIFSHSHYIMPLLLL